jgi:hypothetical protein
MEQKCSLLRKGKYTHKIFLKIYSFLLFFLKKKDIYDQKLNGLTYINLVPMNERTVKRYHLHFHFKKAVFIEAPLIQLNFDLNADTFKNEFKQCFSIPISTWNHVNFHLIEKIVSSFVCKENIDYHGKF